MDWDLLLHTALFSVEVVIHCNSYSEAVLEVVVVCGLGLLLLAVVVLSDLDCLGIIDVEDLVIDVPLNYALL